MTLNDIWDIYNQFIKDVNEPLPDLTNCEMESNTCLRLDYRRGRCSIWLNTDGSTDVSGPLKKSTKEFLIAKGFKIR